MNTKNIFSRIVRASMEHGRVVIVVTAGLMLASYYSLSTLSFDILPEINKPIVTIFAVADGFAAEEVETLVLTPIERSILGAPGVERVRGAASFGQAIVTVEFAWGSDIYRNRQILQEFMSKASLPKDVKPELAPPSSIMGEFLWIGLTKTSDSALTGTELRTLAEWVIKPALLQTKGVSDVLVQGGDVAEVRIEFNQEKLNARGLTFDGVVQALQGAFSNASGGVLVSKEKEYAVRILSPFTNPLEKAASIVVATRDGIPVTLDMVANIRMATSPVRGAATVDGTDGVIVRVIKQADAETLSLTKAIDVQVETLKQSLPQDAVVYTDLFRQETFISNGLSNVERALVESAVMVVIITFLFLLHWRATTVTLLAIPLSILVTFIIFKLFGLTINVMTLGGLAVAVGELVDDAIIGVENVLRRLTDGKRGVRDYITTITDAISEVRNSIVYATALVVVVFFPLLFIPGIEGRLLAPLGVAYIVSLLASLVVSITIAPLLMWYLFKGEREGQSHESKVAVRVRDWFTKWVERAVRYPSVVIAGMAFCIVLTVGLYFTAGKEGIPPFNEGSFTVNVLTPYGSDLTFTKSVSERFSKDAQNIPGVTRVSSIIGRAGGDPHDSGSNQAEVAVIFDSKHESTTEERITAIQSKAQSYSAEAQFSIGQPITHRIEEIISGVRAPIAIKVYGTEYEAMERLARDVAGALAAQPGVLNVTTKKATEVPEVHMVLSAEKMEKRGVIASEYLRGTDDSLIGVQVGEDRTGIARVPIVARVKTDALVNPESLQDLAVNNTLISNVGTIRISTGKNRINHEGGKRFITVSANYNGTNVVGAVEAVVQAFKERRLETGLSLSYEGTYQSQKDSSRILGLAFIVVLFLMFGILYYAFGSSRLALIILANIPTAFVGSMLAIFATGNSLSLAHIVGFISLSGIVARNGIMLVSKIQDKEKAGESATEKAVIESVSERVTPVLMTSLVTGLALVPLLIASGEPGKEMLYPLAVVLTSGLVTSTLASFFVTPVLYMVASKRK
jgi:HME family heavy-metal exporter